MSINQVTAAFDDFTDNYFRILPENRAVKMLEFVRGPLINFEKHHILFLIINEYPEYKRLDPDTFLAIMDITDSWEDIWMAMPAVIKRFYYGRNPFLTSVFTIMR